MGWFFSDKQETSVSTSSFSDTPSNEQIAETWLGEKCSEEHITSLVRHYDIAEVTDHIEQFAGVQISDEATTRIVSKLRKQYGVRPLQEHELPGYISPEDYPEDQAATQTYYTEREQRRSHGISPGDWAKGRR